MFIYESTGKFPIVNQCNQDIINAFKRSFKVGKSVQYLN